jgi:predicted ATPase
MKIARFCLHNYQQFEKIELNLTYPQGHSKAGQPLDKICLIGQSGTGKTTILRAMRQFLEITRSEDAVAPAPQQFSAVATSEDGKWKKTFEKSVLKWQPSHIEGLNERSANSWAEYWGDSKICIHLPAELSLDLDKLFPSKAVPVNPLDRFLGEGDVPYATHTATKRVFDFERDDLVSVWDAIFDKIKRFKVELLAFSQQLMHEIEIEQRNSKKFREKVDAWHAQHRNPLKELSEKLNIILNKFHLEIRPEFMFIKAEDLNFIQIHPIGDKKQRSASRPNLIGSIPRQGWSTGTKQLILTATPLLELNTDKSVVLLDEPERSLYPDVQAELVGFYTQLAPQAQFVFATHSPIVAAAFEPWEIVELKFDEKGRIYQDQYYTGERHVDNYRFDPQLLTWNGVLREVFDFTEEGNPKRKEMLAELAHLDVQIRRLKKDPESKGEFDQLWAKFERIAGQLKWDIGNYASRKNAAH